MYVADYDVLWLDIAMCHLVFMEEMNCLSYLQDNLGRFLLLENSMFFQLGV